MHQFVWKWNPKWARFSYYYYTTTTTNTPGSIFWATFFILCLSPPKNGLLPEGIPCMKLLQTRCDLLMMMCCKFYTPQIHRQGDKNNNIHYFWIMNAFFQYYTLAPHNWIAILFGEIIQSKKHHHTAILYVIILIKEDVAFSVFVYQSNITLINGMNSLLFLLWSYRLCTDVQTAKKWAGIANLVLPVNSTKMCKNNLKKERK